MANIGADMTTAVDAAKAQYAESCVRGIRLVLVETCELVTNDSRNVGKGGSLSPQAPPVPVETRNRGVMHHKVPVDDPLAHVPLFARLSDHDRDAVRSLLTEVRVPAGEILVRQGAIGHEFFVIISGTASVDRGDEHLADVGPGDFEGEISLLDGGVRTATVTATSPMTILVATHQEFSSLLDTAPSIARKMLPALAHRVRLLAGDAHTH